MADTFLEAMKFRHACKEFDSSKKISEEDFASILEYGQLSPSSFGFEPWKFVIIQNEDLREKLKEFTWGGQGQLPTASHFMIILSRKKKSMIYNSEYINEMLEYKQLPEDIKALYKEFYENFQKVDFDLLDNDRNLEDWSMKQTYIALANMMTGAATLGIDTCPIEGFDYKMTQEFISKELDIDSDEFAPAVMVAFGYRKDEAKHEKSRLSMDKITSWYN